MRSLSGVKRPNNLVDVQLLQDHVNLGVKGNIVTVKAAYMRQKLHSTKIACYLNDGPRIPVVETKPVVKKSTKQQKIVTEEETVVPEPSAPLSLSELSNMFSSQDSLLFKNSKAPKSSSPISLTTDVEAEVQVTGDANDITFSSHDINDAIPDANILTLNQGEPITKEMLKDYGYDISGIEIPISLMRIQGSKKEPINEITKKGEYTWVINTSDNKAVRRALIVQ